MLLIAIPHWVKYIEVEFDKTIWGHRYEPIGPPSDSGNSRVLGLNTNCSFISKNKIISLINNEVRFLDEHMDIVTKKGNKYKDLILRTLIASGKLTHTP